MAMINMNILYFGKNMLPTTKEPVALREPAGYKDPAPYQEGHVLKNECKTCSEKNLPRLFPYTFRMKTFSKTTPVSAITMIAANMPAR